MMLNNFCYYVLFSTILHSKHESCLLSRGKNKYVPEVSVCFRSPSILGNGNSYPLSRLPQPRSCYRKDWTFYLSLSWPRHHLLKLLWRWPTQNLWENRRPDPMERTSFTLVSLAHMKSILPEWSGRWEKPSPSAGKMFLSPPIFLVALLSNLCWGGQKTPWMCMTLSAHFRVSCIGCCILIPFLLNSSSPDLEYDSTEHDQVMTILTLLSLFQTYLVNRNIHLSLVPSRN